LENKVLNITNLAENYTKETPPNKHTYKNLRKAFLFLLPSLLLTIVAVFYTAQAVDEKNRVEFTTTCEEISAKIYARLHAHAELLRCSAALFATTEDISRENWKAFFNASKIDRNLPGIQGLGYTVLIRKQDLQKHLTTIRNQGFPDYTINPWGEREIYSSIIYLEPFTERNLRAFGFDMLTEPTRRKAMELARDSDVAALSGKVILLQETTQEIQFGTVMYIPVYRNGMPINTIEERRNAIIGWVFSPYRMNDLMNGILGNLNNTKLKELQLKLYDDSLSNATLIYESKLDYSKKINHLPSQAFSLPANFHGKNWVISFSEYRNPIKFFESEVLVVAISGLLINIFLFILFIALINTKRNALRIASKLTSELKVNESKLNAILDNSFDAIAVHVDGICIMCNIAALKLFGFANKEMIIGHPIMSAIAPSEQKRIQDYIFKRINGIDAPFVYATKGIKTDGHIFDLEVSLSTFYHSNKQHVLVILRDISERLQAENKIVSLVTRYQTLLQMASDGIHILNDQGQIVEVNNSFCKMLGYSREEMMGLSLADWDNQWNYEELQAKLKELILTGGLFQTRHRCKDGSIIDVEINGGGIKLDNQNYLYASARDITERKRLENELKEYTHQLKRSNDDLENFAYIASHDLKAPLNVVIKILELIDNGTEAPTSSNKLEYIRMAKKSIAQMSGLIKDLLDYSRIGTNQENFSQVNLNETLEYILNVLKDKISQINARIIVHDLPAIFANKTLINELFLNLLNNALTYHNKIAVEIEVWCTEEKEAYKFYVKDNGIGIQEKDFEKIFLIFKRLHTQSDYAGTGIGLALCKRIVDIHKGEIWVESTFGQGSTFYFTIKKFQQ
jgi:PAS domain S-box-containing protein